MLCLGIEYLTGYCVATHPSARDMPEWPPHPARVFMALAAAYFEAGEAPLERRALEFVENISGSPTILASRAEPRSSVTHYVPVNDVLDHKPRLPDFHSRQPRGFPRVRPDNPVVYFYWPDATADAQTVAALRALCDKVTRIGHSSSLVHAWIADQTPDANGHDHWMHDDSRPEAQFRAITPGSLAELERLYRAGDMAEYDRLQNLVGAAKGQAKKSAKQELASRFGGNRPRPVRPEFQVTTGYRIARPATGTPAHSVWNDKLLIFGFAPLEIAHPRLDILSVPALVNGLRSAILKVAANQLRSIPEYISGHKSKEGDSPSEQPHCALIPLPFVGHEHADGHILGVAVATPRSTTAAERRAVAQIISTISKEGLTLGRIGKWKLLPEAEVPTLHNLRAAVWTGGHCGSQTWSSITPVAFDEHPKSKDVDGYQNEIRDMIMKACVRIGLPEPERIDISHVSFIQGGVPTAYQFRRLARKDGSLRRQLHARIVFSTSVIGPILLGAGRYRGYGLFRPLREHAEND